MKKKNLSFGVREKISFLKISVTFENLEKNESIFLSLFAYFGWWTWLKLGDRLKTLARKMSLFLAELGLPPRRGKMELGLKMVLGLDKFGQVWTSLNKFGQV